MSVAWSRVGNRLALGVEPIDAVSGLRVARPIHVDVERPGLAWLREDREGFARAAGRGRAPISRHETGRHAMIMRDDLGESVQLRIYDRRRGFVPRRLAIPLPLAAEIATAPRIRRPVLFPGVAWDLIGGSTALRSRVRRAGQPVRWARLEGRRPGEPEVLLRSRADDRGEFLLVLGVATLAQAELEGQFELEVEAFGPPAAMVPPSEGDALDPLWDLPVETLAAPGVDDPVALGEGPPPVGWISLGSASLTFELGRTLSDQASLDF
ncbi:hypothetical protein ACNOYE_19300 [Nannocystaceae bacterium ST9]